MANELISRSEGTRYSRRGINNVWTNRVDICQQDDERWCCCGTATTRDTTGGFRKHTCRKPSVLLQDFFAGCELNSDVPVQGAEIATDTGCQSLDRTIPFTGDVVTGIDIQAGYPFTVDDIDDTCDRIAAING